MLERVNHLLLQLCIGSRFLGLGVLHFSELLGHSYFHMMLVECWGNGLQIKEEETCLDDGSIVHHAVLVEKKELADF